MSDDHQSVMRPAAPQQHAAGTAGLVNSGAGDGGAVQPLRRGPAFPLGRAALVALIIGLSLSSPLLGSAIVLFGVAVMALGLARGAGRAFAGACIVGSAAIAGAVTASADPDVRWMVSAVIGAALFAALGVEHARAATPDPDAGTDVGGEPFVAGADADREPTLAEQVAREREASAASEPAASSAQPHWPEPRIDRGVSYASYAWLVVSIVLVGLVGGLVGEPRLSSALVSTVDSGFADYDEACAKGGVLENDDRTCDQIAETRTFLEDATRDHAPTVFALFVSLVAIGGAWLAHLVVVARNRALAQQGWAVATRPAYRLRQLEFHWSWAYVGAVGVLAMIVARELDGLTQEWIFAAGAGIASVAGQVIVMQGTGVAAWLFSRLRMPGWYRVVLAVATLFIWPFVLLGLLVMGALDMWLGLRRRAITVARPSR